MTHLLFLSPQNQIDRYRQKLLFFLRILLSCFLHVLIALAAFWIWIQQLATVFCFLSEKMYRKQWGRTLIKMDTKCRSLVQCFICMGWLNWWMFFDISRCIQSYAWLQKTTKRETLLKASTILVVAFCRVWEEMLLISGSSTWRVIHFYHSPRAYQSLLPEQQDILQ